MSMRAVVARHLNFQLELDCIRIHIETYVRVEALWCMLFTLAVMLIGQQVSKQTA